MSVDSSTYIFLLKMLDMASNSDVVGLAGMAHHADGSRSRFIVGDAQNDNKLAETFAELAIIQDELIDEMRGKKAITISK